MEPKRRPCPFTLPDGIPLMDATTFDKLHSHAGGLAYQANRTEGIGGLERLDEDGIFELVDSARFVLGLATDALDLAVWAARDHGWSWQKIGDCFGISRQAAQQRFAPHARNPAT